MANGETYSDEESGRSVLCLCDGDARIQKESCPPGTIDAVAGSQHLVANGEVVFHHSGDKPAPRTAIALDQTRQTMWLLVVDGRQPDYSVGVTREELAHLAVEVGAYTAINMDGGGSSTLVVSGSSGPEVLNAPYHTRIRMRERPVANHLGIIASELIDNEP